MNEDAVIRRTLFVVDRCLRKAFPNDYDERCMYGALAISALLQDANIDAHVTGGDVLAFILAVSEEEVSLQGFGSGRNGPSHYWVEVEGTVVDLGPSYLPKGSRFPAVPMPFIAWQDESGLPKYLRYRPAIKYSPGVELSSTAEINARMDAFLETCRKRYAVQRGQPKLPTWILHDEKSTEDAAKRGDRWAINAKRFARQATFSELPF